MADVRKEIELEIAHVLFIDIVGYSKLSLDQQRAAIEELNEIVRTSAQFQKSEADGQLLKLATGDGMALVFTTSPQAPAQCALELARALKTRPHLLVRMGVHSGPVNGISDVSGNANVAGINTAQRVMSCGDAGHILLSKHAAEDLVEFERWRSRLHELGAAEVKHGTRITLVNLHDDEIGNPAVPIKMRMAQHRRWRLRAALAAGLLIAVAVVAGVLVRRTPKLATAETIPQKTIAVLPFENLSEDKQNAFFADGVQDEILTDLARVADLKVISRTSVIGYRDTIGRNLRKIGQELGVAHVLEGSVQRAGNRVRVNAQLIDARNDAHLWAQTYDRDLADVFAIQSEIAKAIADQLQAKLSSHEITAIERAPTHDVAAFDLYARAKELLRSTNVAKPALLQAVDLLNQAVARDPGFLAAYCQLVAAHGLAYQVNIDRTPARLALAEEAAETASRLGPDAGETHLARARIFYPKQDYQNALAELEVAGRSLPNDSEVPELKGYVERRLGRWEDCIRDSERAIELDPRNANILAQVALTYDFMRRYADERSAYNRILLINPNDALARIHLATVDLHEKADARPYHDAIEAVRRKNPSAVAEIADEWLLCALFERDSNSATQALNAWGENAIELGFGDNTFFIRPFVQGVIARVSKDEVKAREAFTAARAEQEKLTQAQPENAYQWCVLGLIDAALSRKEEALREARRAVELLPFEKDAKHGPTMNKYLAMTAAWLGEKDLAFEQLAFVLSRPNDLSYGELKLMPLWDPLRSDPRFEKILVEAKQPIALKPKQ
jgi:TolB-like protein/class 3 adenylate cyclase/Flp pilus assembly protein TadD